MPERHNSPCIATDGINVYVVGGLLSGNVSRMFQQYSLENGDWTHYVNKPMKDARRQHACAVHYGFLYAFGGFGTGSQALSNEKISIGETIGGEWTHISYNGQTNSW